MISTYLTSISAKFNPFARAQRMPRIFLSLLPPNARNSIKISVAQFPQSSEEKALLNLTFKDGKEMLFDPETSKLKEVIAEVDRHSRMLARKDDLTSG